MDISIVIPIYNESRSINRLYKEIVGVMTSLEKSFEIIFIDDGSTDSTFNILKGIDNEANKNGVNFKYIKGEYNFGKGAALQVGFKEASGKIIITMDGDLQDDPNEIPKLINKINEGYDLVSGWKFKRHDSLTKVIPSKIFNFIISRLTRVRIHDFNCCLKAYRREVVKGLDINGGLYRFIPALVFYKGFKIAEIKVNHRPRIYGKSKYGFKRFFQAFFDLFTIVFLIRFNKIYVRNSVKYKNVWK